MTDPSRRECYEILGASFGATKKELRKLYSKLMMRLHPDQNPNSDKKILTEKCAMATVAYAILTDKKMTAAHEAGGKDFFDTLVREAVMFWPNAYATQAAIMRPFIQCAFDLQARIFSNMFALFPGVMRETTERSAASNPDVIMMADRRRAHARILRLARKAAYPNSAHTARAA